MNNWIKKIFGVKASAATSSVSESATAGGYLGDLAKTQQLMGLFQAPHSSRNEAWLHTFYNAIADASFCAGSPQVLTGPDGFPYFVLLVPPVGKAFQCYVLRHMKNDFLLAQGLGVVIEPGEGQPQWVFSYGDIVQFHLSGSFVPQVSDAPSPSSGTEVIKEQEQILTGQPSEQLLPSASRAVLRHFFAQQGVTNPHLALMTRISAQGPEQSLVFDVRPEHVGGDSQRFDWMMRSVGWFLPRHYRYASMEHASLGSAFQPL